MPLNTLRFAAVRGSAFFLSVCVVIVRITSLNHLRFRYDYCLRQNSAPMIPIVQCLPISKKMTTKNPSSKGRVEIRGATLVHCIRPQSRELSSLT